MPTYVVLYKLTDQGIKDIKGAPGRYEEGVKKFEVMGGKVICFYATMGEYDYVGIGEAPNDEVAMIYALALGALGNVRTTTLKAFTTEEFAKIVSKLP
jgi:uncharacterized protein with GYD domain